METQYAAQAMATQAALDTGSAAHGVFVTAKVKGGALVFLVWTTKNGAMESVRLLCSATSLERLTAQTKSFIDNLS